MPQEVHRNGVSPGTEHSDFHPEHRWSAAEGIQSLTQHACIFPHQLGCKFKLIIFTKNSIHEQLIVTACVHELHTKGSVQNKRLKLLHCA